MVPVVALAIVAVVVIKSLMRVVAHDEVPGYSPATADFAPARTFDPTMPAPAFNDDVRAFLLPAAPGPSAVEPGEVEQPAAASGSGGFDRSRQRS